MTLYSAAASLWEPACRPHLVQQDSLDLPALLGQQRPELRQGGDPQQGVESQQADRWDCSRVSLHDQRSKYMTSRVYFEWPSVVGGRKLSTYCASVVLSVAGT